MNIFLTFQILFSIFQIFFSIRVSSVYQGGRLRMNEWPAACEEQGCEPRKSQAGERGGGSEFGEGVGFPEAVVGVGIDIFDAV